MKLYSIYERMPNETRYTRRSEYAYPIAQARRIFQQRLIDSILSGRDARLMPAKVDRPKAQGITKFR